MSGTERRLDPFGLAALITSGTLAAHQLGYLADSGGQTSHAYFAVVGPIVVLSACIAGWAGAVRILRRDGGRPPSVAQLTMFQVALFLMMEVTERLVSGSLHTLFSLPVALGLVAQPLVAFVALQLLRVGGRILQAFAWPTANVAAARRTFTSTEPAMVALRSWPSSVRLRGPPNESISRLSFI